MQLFGFSLKVYDAIFAAALVLLCVIGLFSAFHLRLPSKADKAFSHVEIGLLRLPGIWLTSSMWLNYFTNTTVGLAIACSIAVVVMSAFNDDVDVERVVVYTLTSLTCSLLSNFTHSQEKSQAYRRACDLMRPACEQFESRYRCSSPSFSYAERMRDLDRFIEIRACAEAVIRDAHSYNAQERREEASLLEASAVDGDSRLEPSDKS